MKGKLLDDPNFYPENLMPYSLIRGKEYTILGIDSVKYYYVYNELNNIDLVPVDIIEITDNNHPAFWEIDESNKNRLVPKEWHWHNFLSFDGEPYIELWNYEIWSITQFVKGINKYDLPIFPVNFRRALDASYKLDLINAYLKLAAQYDSLKQGDLLFHYLISSYSVSEEILNDSKNTLLTEKSSGFEILRSILQIIGEPLQHILKTKSYEFEEIRNRILFSIWALFGTKEFKIIKLKKVETEVKYLLINSNKSFVLSFDYFT